MQAIYHNHMAHWLAEDAKQIIFEEKHVEKQSRIFWTLISRIFSIVDIKYSQG